MPPKKKKPSRKKAEEELSPIEQALNDDAKRGWQYSDAKASLTAAILDGEIPLDEPSDEDEDDLLNYFHSRPEIANHGGDLEFFKHRLKALGDDIRKEQTRADEDQKAFDIFKKNHPKSTVAAAGNYPEWEGSEAQELLKQAMANNQHHELKPLQMWESKDAYQLFPLKVFCDHIYQEIRTEKYMNYLQSNKKGYKWKEHMNKNKKWCSDEGFDSSGDED